MIKLLDKLDHERVNRIWPFVSLKEKELRNENKSSSQTNGVPPQTP